MTCIKTGARVYLPDYGLAAPADLFAVSDDAVIIRFNGNPQHHQCNFVKEQPKNTTHVVRCNPEFRTWLRWDLGVLVVHASMIAGVVEVNRNGDIELVPLDGDV